MTETMNRTESVIAEDAPIGVQLWPTRSPAFAPNFTLERVEIVRNEVRTFVRWVYQNGNERLFQLGESVAVRWPCAHGADCTSPYC